MRINGRLQQAEKQAAALPWYHGLEGEALEAAMRQFNHDVATIQALEASGRYTLDELQAMPLASYYQILDREQSIQP